MTILMHRPHMRVQVARRPEGSGALGADVVPALLMHRPHMRVQAARPREGSGALGADVVPALLMHCPHMFRKLARNPKRSRAVWARARLGVRDGVFARGSVPISRHAGDARGSEVVRRFKHTRDCLCG